MEATAPAEPIRPPDGSPLPRARRSWRPAFIIAVLAVLAVLLLTGLGNRGFWDDEALTALYAKAILRTGDTSVQLDHGNIIAYRNGVTLHGFRECVSPVLACYVTAGSFALFGLDAWAARLPFAFAGLGTAALMLLWAKRETPTRLGVLALGLIGNVSLILYARNCRYYSLTIFLSVALASVYWRRQPDRRSLAVFTGLSILLLASNYLNYLAFYACLAIDYLLWQRREFPLGWRSVAAVLVPQLVAGVLLASIWNPFLTGLGSSAAGNSLTDRCALFWWNLRDANECEFFSIPLLLLALGTGIAQRRTWLVRGVVTIVLYVAFITVLSPQPVSETQVADVRYIVPIIPLAIALEAGVICALCGSRTWLAGAAALLAFGTNLLNGGPLLHAGFRSTLCSYVGELAHPVPDPFKTTADWINAHVPEGSSVWVEPNPMTYPLMFHAPNVLYAWQLTWPARPPLDTLPDIHFQGKVPPDYLVAFGPGADNMSRFFSRWNRPDVRYRKIRRIDIFWDNVSRPEVFLHVFGPYTDYSPDREAIYILQRIPAPVDPR